MRLQAEEATVLARTHMKELEAQDEDNHSANELSWEDFLLTAEANIDEEQANIDEEQANIDEELNLSFSARRITMNVDRLTNWKAQQNQFPTFSH